jgi:AraC family transcriptional regulator
LLFDSYALQLAVILVRNWSSASEMVRLIPQNRGGLAPKQLARVREAMDCHIDGDVTLSELAAEAGCSPTHFSRAFKQSTIMSQAVV